MRTGPLVLLALVLSATLALVPGPAQAEAPGASPVAPSGQTAPPPAAPAPVVLIPNESRPFDAPGPCATYTVTVMYAGGPAMLSGGPSSPIDFAADDTYRVTVVQTGYSRDFVSMTKDVPAFDLGPYLRLGANTIVAQAVNVDAPTCGGGWLYLLGVTAADTVPPSITGVTSHPDGMGNTIVMATITDNVSVASATLHWNGQEFAMQPVSGDRYYAIVRGQPNGITGKYHITATDPTGNVGSTDPRLVKIRHTNWAATQRNTARVGDPVNSATGSFLTQHLDVQAPAPGIPFRFLRTYESLQADNDGPFGFGHSHSFNVRLVAYDDPLIRGVLVTYEDGRTAVFQQDGSGFRAPPGTLDVLSRDGTGYVLTRPDQVKYRLDADGRLTSVEDRNANAIRLMYSGGNLSQITDTAGRAYRLDYDGSHISRITDALNRAYQYGYDGGNLVWFRDPDGGVIRYAYDGDHRMVSIADANGHVFVTNAYDERGRVTAQKDAAGVASSIAYPDEQRRVFTDGAGNATTYVYDDRFRLVEERDALGRSKRNVYNDADHVVQTVDRGGHATAFTYDSAGNVLTRQNALGQTATYTYDRQNNVTSARDETGASTTYAYEGGNLVLVRDPAGGQTKLTYNGQGLPVTRTDPNGAVTKMTYDARGNLETVTDAGGAVTHYAYDAMGRQTSMTDGNRRTVTYTYSPADRITAITDPAGKVTRLSYDPVGNLRSVTDRRGKTTLLEYDVNDNLTKVTDARGNAASFTYNAAYRRIAATDRRGNSTTYTYDATYNVVKITDPSGAATSFTYDADGALAAVTDALGGVTGIERDALHRVVKLTDAGNGVTRYAYDGAGRLTSLTDPRNGHTQYAYDAVGRLTKVTDPLGGVTQLQYDAAGNLTKVTNARSAVTQLQYDAVHNLVQRTDALGRRVQLAYDPVGNVLRLTDGRGQVTAFTYDSNDNLVQVTDAAGGRLSYQYDEEGNQVASTDQNGNTTRYAFDAVGNVEQMTLPRGQTTRFAYDANSNLVSVTNAKGHTTRLDYDSRDLLAARTDPLGNRTRLDHDALRRLVRTVDALDHATSYGFDALSRLVDVVDAEGGRTSYEYDRTGSLTAVVDANRNRTEFENDLLGRVTKERNPLGKTWQYQYDAAGNLTRRTDARGVVTTYQYDQIDRLTRIAYPGVPAVSLGYDENGNLTSMADGTGTSAFAYDPLNRRTQVRRSGRLLPGLTLGYVYDPAGNRTQITYPDGKTVRSAYDANNWLVSTTDPLGGATTYERDAGGLPVKMTYPNGTQAEYAYDAADRLLSVINRKPGATPQLISGHTYTLDAVGNRTRTVEQLTRGQVVTWQKDYTYDKVYRLLSAVETPDAQPYQVLSSAYTYDAVGNRLTETTNIHDRPNTPALREATTTRYRYDAANRMLSAGATTFRYDDNGNRIAMDGPTRAAEYGYDAENRMVGAKTYSVQPNGRRQLAATLDFSYDALGRRLERGVTDRGVRKTAATLYDGLGYDALAEYVAPGAPRTTYYYRDPQQVLSRHEQQGTGAGLQHFHHYDGLGSVSAWTNHAGQATQSYRYAPYGRLLDNNGPTNSSNQTEPHNDLTFSGKPWDQTTELSYFGARDYDASTGTWLTPDPYPGRLAEPATLHRYQYVRNNPINRVDPYGFDSITLKNGQKVELPANIQWTLGDLTSCLGGSNCLNGSDPERLQIEGAPTSAQKSLNGGTLPSGTTAEINKYGNLEIHNLDITNEFLPLFSRYALELKKYRHAPPLQSAAFIYNVWPGHKWDVKPKWGYAASVKIGSETYRTDVTGNILYGFLAHSIGWTEDWALWGGGMAQLGTGNSSPHFALTKFDDPVDSYAVQMGWKLWDAVQYGEVTPELFNKTVGSYEGFHRYNYMHNMKFHQ